MNEKLGLKGMIVGEMQICTSEQLFCEQLVDLFVLEICAVGPNPQLSMKLAL